MQYQGSCHCGSIAFEVEGDFTTGMECNCSHCSRKGYVLAFVPRASLNVEAAGTDLATYTFNKHQIKHHFCSTCGCAPFGYGEFNGAAMAAINLRCLDDFDLAGLKREYVDGKSF